MITDARETRGKAIAYQGNQIKKVNDHSFKVKSQSGGGFYEVKETKTGMTCNCPDFVYRGGKCKHIAATRYYLEIEKDTPQGTVTEKVHLTYTQAWNAYNEAQKAEIKLFDDLLKDLVKTIPEPEQTIGRPLVDRAYRSMRLSSAQSRKCTLSYPAAVLMASLRTRPNGAKSPMHHTSTRRPPSLTNQKQQKFCKIW
jgi:hypothetical protein